MSDYQQKVSGSFNERMRLIRLRRKKENLRFWEEFRIVPRGLIWTIVFLFVVAQTIAFLVNRWYFIHDPRRSSHRQLFLSHRLCQPRLQTPRHELRFMDPAGHRPSPGMDFHWLPHLFPHARAYALRLPSMWKIRRGPIQLLPQLQMQPSPILSQLQTRSRRNRQVLPLLRAGPCSSSRKGNHADYA